MQPPDHLEAMREEINEIKRTGVMVGADDESVQQTQGIIEEARGKLNDFVKEFRFGDDDEDDWVGVGGGVGLLGQRAGKKAAGAWGAAEEDDGVEERERMRREANKE